MAMVVPTMHIGRVHFAKTKANNKMSIMVNELLRVRRGQLQGLLEFCPHTAI